MGPASERRFLVIGLGEVLWDLLPTGKALGGAPANFAYHAQALGATGIVASRVGGDALGDEVLRCLDAMGMDRRCVERDAIHATGACSVTVAADGQPRHRIHEDVAWDFLAGSPTLTKLATQADAVCFGTLAQRSPVARRTIREVLRDARPGCLRVLDINLRQAYWSKDTITESLQAADVLKLNDEELPVVSDVLGLAGEPLAAMCALLERHQLRLVALTKGARGSELVTRAGHSVHPGVPTPHVVGTIGAGDAFAAALVMGLLRGRPLEAINEHANRVASFVCTQPGATPKLPAALCAG